MAKKRKKLLLQQKGGGIGHVSRSLFASSGKAYTRIGDLNTEGRITEIITRLREDKRYCYNRRVVV